MAGEPPPRIFSPVSALDYPGLAFLAPQAEDYTWYPTDLFFPSNKMSRIFQRFEKNREIVNQVEARGIPAEKIFIGGFSQGACLAVNM